MRAVVLFQVGHSQPSTITELRTGCTVPACPGPPRVTGATKSTVTLAWKAPEETGGSQVLDYEAEVQPKSRAAMDGGMADEWMLVYQVRLMSPLHHSTLALSCIGRYLHCWVNDLSVPRACAVHLRACSLDIRGTA